MASYFLRRVLMAIPVMAFIALFIFLLLRLTPGDPAQAIAGDHATPQQLSAIRESLGLDKPLASQFLTWVGNMTAGRFRQIADLAAAGAGDDRTAYRPDPGARRSSP